MNINALHNHFNVIDKNKKEVDAEVVTLTALVQGKAGQSGVDANAKAITDATAAITALSGSFNATIAAINQTMIANMALVQTMNTTLQKQINDIVSAAQTAAAQMTINQGQILRNGNGILGLSTNVQINLADIKKVANCSKCPLTPPQKSFKTRRMSNVNV